MASSLRGDYNAKAGCGSMVCESLQQSPDRARGRRTEVTAPAFAEPGPRRPRAALRVVALSLAVILSPTARADAEPEAAPTPATGQACGQPLSAALFDKWMTTGGEHGFLGCPIQRETSALASPSGAGAREALFSNGEILWHASGPHAGQTFFLAGCFFRLYFQFGGSGGWLGLPLSDPQNTPDGKRQTFEGGVITYQRALDQCDAERGAPPPSVLPTATKAPLNLFADPASGAYFSTASLAGAAEAAQLHLQAIETEGFVFVEPAPGLKALKTYLNDTTGDHMTIATDEGERIALAGGYAFDGLQGYVFADPHPGAAPLTLWWNPEKRMSLLAVTEREQSDAKSAGYQFVRVEGYVPIAP